jgi:hypothetical protein
MDYTLVDGGSAPDPETPVRVRVLRKETDELAVDRPNRDHPLELRGETEIVVPSDPGTYEVRGLVRLVMLADQDGADFLFLKNHHVEHIADDVQRLPRQPSGPDWKTTDAKDVDVEVDPDSLVPDESVAEQAESRPSAGEPEQQRPNLNELLLNTR